MRFLGRKLHHAFTGKVVINRKKRPEGANIHKKPTVLFETIHQLPDPVCS